MSAAGLILAAGESRRMGYPKALLEYRGVTFLDAAIGLMERRCSPVIVVLGSAAEQVRAGVKRQAAFVVNSGWQGGQLTSMQCGLRAAPPQADGVLFTLVDHPAVAPDTMAALLGPPDGGPRTELLRIPRYRGRRGHPIWFSSSLIPEFLALPEDGAAKDVVHLHAAETLFVDVDDPGILVDIDDPASYRALMGEAQ